jgi:ESX secretion-associated protein EspG
VLRARVELSMEVLTAFWRWEGLDRMPPVLVSSVEWLDEQARRDADQRALAELAACGLVTAGAVAGELRETIQVLTRPEVEFFGWIGGAHQTVGVLGAACGRDAVLVVRSGQSVTLSSVRPDAVAEAVVAQLPPLAPAQGRSLNVAASDLTGERAAGDEEGFAGFGQQAEAHDVRALRALLAQPALGGGQLYVAVRGRDGRRRQSDTPITVRDTAEGRWLTQTVTTSGQRWVITAPASPQLLVSKLYETWRVLADAGDRS